MSLIRRPSPPLPATHYLDNRIFTDPEIFALERSMIFEKVWNFVCHESELPEAGSYRSVEVAGHPLVITRDQDMQLHAIHNACPHRGQRLVRAVRGRSPSLQCFYHLWNFALDGRLRQTMRPQGYEGTSFDRSDHCIPAVRVASIHGLVFVCLDDETESLEDFLGPAAKHFEKTLGSEPMEVFFFHRALFKTNWKLWNDNNSELYHEYMHYLNRNTNLKGTSFFDRQWKMYRNGHNGVAEAEVAYEAGGLGNREAHLLPGTRPNGFSLTNLFPDTVVNCRSTVIRMDRMVPMAPGLTLVEWRGIGVKDEPAEIRAMREQHFTEIWGPCGRNITEDQIAVETQWASMASQAAPYTILAREEGMRPMDDCNLRAYYQEWGRRMGRSAHAPFATGQAPNAGTMQGGATQGGARPTVPLTATET
ncbi:MAG: aromatic ring-hydroxylating dioxygenase subunit alpha [Burkholderiaceae bacterium]